MSSLQRRFRVGEVLRRALADVLMRGEVADLELDALSVTVPEVRMNADMSVAVCYVIPLGGGHRDDVARILARHAAFLRGVLARRVALRRMPRLRFCFDHSFDNGAAFDRLLARERQRCHDDECGKQG